MPAPTEVADRVPGANSGASHGRGRARPVHMAVLAGLAAAAIAVGAIILSAQHGPRPAGPLSGAQINAALRDFATDYSRHDVRGLSRLLAANVSRVDPSSSQLGRAAVLREYESQFATRPVPRSYALSDVRITPGWAGRAEGQYTLTVTGGGHLSGHVVFGLERAGNRVQVALISTR